MSINVTLYRYSVASSGVDASETVLTPANVVAGSFGKQFTTPVDGQVLAQPVYMAGVNITTGSSPGVHNVVFVATENDSLYAIDAGSGQVLWQDSFLINTTGVTVTTVPSADVNSGDISPQIGITDTPAIDATNGYLYVVAKTKAVHSSDPSGEAHYVNTLYMVDIYNGTFTSTVIADTTATSNGSYYNAPFTYNSGPYVLGTGDGSVNVGGQNRVYFNSLTQQFRPAVELDNVTVNGQTVEEVVLGSASHGDNGPYHGWMLTYNASTLALTGVLNTTPNGGLGGIWAGGDGIVSDPEGYFYFETGNGTFDTTLNSAGFPINGDYSDSFVKVAVDPTTSQSNQNENGWGLKVVDYFTPWDQQALSNADEDLGSGGPTILPDYSATDPNPQPASATYPHLLVGGGKDGVVYLINRDNMGKYSPSTNNVLQQLGTTNPSNFSEGAVGGILSTPAYFNGQLYITSGYSGPIDAFSLNNAQLSVATDYTTADSFGNLDGSPTVSADGTVNGIVWALERGSGQLRAYNAANLSEIYNSSTVAADAPGSIMKFTVPVVANGGVYVGTGNSLVMYGLNAPPTSPPAAPSNLAVTSFSGSEVSLSWTDNSSASSDRDSAFNIQRSTDDVTFAQIGTAGVNQTTYVDATVQPFTTYYYRVNASNSIGASAFSNVASANTLGQPAVGGGDGLLGQYFTFDGTIADFNTDATAKPLLTVRRSHDRLQLELFEPRPRRCPANGLRGCLDRRTPGPVFRKLYVFYGQRRRHHADRQRPDRDQRFHVPFPDDRHQHDSAGAGSRPELLHSSRLFPGRRGAAGGIELVQPPHPLGGHSAKPVVLRLRAGSAHQLASRGHFGHPNQPYVDHQLHRRGRLRGRSHAGQFGHFFRRGLPASRFQ